MASEWPWTLNCQKYPACTKYLTSSIKFCSILLYNPFWDTLSLSIIENTSTLRDLAQHWTPVKTTIYNPKSLPQRPIFLPVSHYDLQFSRYKVVENRNAQNDLEQVMVKSSCVHYTLSTDRRGASFDPFRSTSSHFRYIRLKIGMHRMTSGWPRTFNDHKYPIYTKYLPLDD